MRDNRGPWYLLTGLILGGALGLIFSWLVYPVRYVDTAPASLRSDFKDQYRALIAAAYLSTGDLERAKARLALLKDDNPVQSLSIQAQIAQADGHSEAEVKALNLLASALSHGPVASPTPQNSATPTAQPGATLSPTPLLPTNDTTAPVQVSASISETMTVPAPTAPQATSTPRPTVTPLPTRTATPTQGAPFALKEQDLVCDPAAGQSLIQVETLDAAGQPVPGVEFIVSWGNSQDHFFTGLKPELGAGYADFLMSPGVTYTLQLAEGGQPVNGVTASECESSDGTRYWGSWKIVFVQP